MNTGDALIGRLRHSVIGRLRHSVIGQLRHSVIGRSTSSRGVFHIPADKKNKRIKTPPGLCCFVLFQPLCCSQRHEWMDERESEQTSEEMLMIEGHEERKREREG